MLKNVLLCRRTQRTAQIEENGVWTPNSGVIQALRLQFPKWYRTAIETIQSFCVGSMMAVPSSEDFHNENVKVLRMMFDGEEISSRERHALLNLAWDVTGSDLDNANWFTKSFTLATPCALRLATFMPLIPQTCFHR